MVAFESLDAIMEWMRADMNTHYERMITIIKTGLEERKAVAEHQEVPTEEAEVKSSGTMKMWDTGRHLAAGQCGEPKELTRGEYGTWRKLAATWRKVSHREAMAQHKRNKRIQENVDHGRNWPQPTGRSLAMQK
jgi:hypothetical protein